ncbi:VIT1/CCC1 transporter family protein [Candidatus Nitrospira bockiana]
MSQAGPHDSALARTLILDEIFDLALYRELRALATGPLRNLLDELIQIETGHVAFWQNFFESPLTSLDLPRRIKLRILLIACRLFGAPAIHLVLEAIEVYGVRKYLSIWKAYRDRPLGTAVRGILIDEFKHEDVIVSQMTERKINPERIRNIFLGLNDGLVEILGAVSGFFGAFGDAVTVLIAGTTTAVAGSLSMAAGAYVALSSEREVERMEEDKKRFLGEASLPGQYDDRPRQEPGDNRPFGSASLVGGSYFAGAMVPLLPVALGATDALFSLLTAGTVIILVSMLLAFLSGMEIKRRIATNVIIIAAAVGVTYVIGRVVKDVLGIAV